MPRVRHAVLAATWLAAALATPACAEPPRQVWLAPNLGSPDLRELFTRPHHWPGARGAVDVFKFYEAHLLAESSTECRECGPNLWPALEQAGAFERLAAWGIEVAVESGALKEWACTSALTADITRQALANVRAAGGRLRYVAMDEPLLGAQDCGFTLEETARQVARFAREVRLAEPGAEVGDIEPYPHFGAGTLLAWLSALESAGARPAFFHLDVDRVLAARRKADVARDLQTIEGWCRLQGVPFGVIFWSPQVGSDRAFYDDTWEWMRTVQDAIGTPTHVIFQSWARSRAGVRQVPRNLPEADPRAHTLTRLLLEGLRARPDGPRPR